MSEIALTIRETIRSRRGVLALSVAIALLLIIFTTLLAFTKSLAAQHLRTEKAWAATQALYAAEAGLDVILQTRSAGPAVSQCGRARYAATIRGRQALALGQVELASGTLIRRAVTVQYRPGGGIVLGSWRMVPPATQGRLVSLLQAEQTGDEQ